MLPGFGVRADIRRDKVRTCPGAARCSKAALVYRRASSTETHTSSAAAAGASWTARTRVSALLQRRPAPPTRCLTCCRICPLPGAAAPRRAAHNMLPCIAPTSAAHAARSVIAVYRLPKQRCGDLLSEVAYSPRSSSGFEVGFPPVPTVTLCTLFPQARLQDTRRAPATLKSAQQQAQQPVSC